MLRQLGINTDGFAQAINVTPDATHGIGSGDDTAFLQAKLNQVSKPLGLTHVVLRGGTWMIDGVNEAQATHANRYRGGGLIPKAGTTLVLGEGATLQVITNNSPAYSVISLDQGQDDVTILGGTILGDRATHDYTTDTSSPTHEFGFGIYARAVSRIRIEGVTIRGCTGDCILTASIGLDDTLPDYVGTNQITIRDCTLDGARRNNISIIASDQVLIENNRISNAGINDGVHDGTAPRAGIDLEYSTHQAVKNITIRGNVFINNPGGCVNVFNANDVVVEGNYSDTGVVLGNNARRVLIRGNVLYRATPDATGGLTAVGGSVGTVTQDVQIDGNWIDGFAVGVGVQFAGAVVRNNRITNFADYGIQAYQVATPEITQNTVVGDKTSTTQVGIRLTACTDPKVKGNTVSGCYYGVRCNTIAGVGTYFISGNTFLDCFDSIRTGIACAVTVARNEFRPGAHGAGVGNDVVWTSTASVIATSNEHHGSGVAYSGASTGATYSRVVGNTLSNVTALNAMVFTGAGGKHIVLRNTIISNRPSGSAGEAITISGGVGSVVVGNTVWSIGAVVFTRLVKTTGSTTTTVKANHFDGATLATTDASDFVGPNYLIGASEPVVSSGGTSAVTTAYKTADTTRNNTISRTADPHLTLAVEANSVYAVELWLGYEATTAADFAIGWSAPSGATMSWSSGGLAVNATTNTSSTLRQQSSSITASITLGGTGAAGRDEARPIGTLTTTSAGTFALTWAQATAEVSDAILYLGSWMRLTKLL